MQQNHRPASFEQGTLNTLAQSGGAAGVNPAVIIQGHGSELLNDKAITGRAKRKVIAQSLALALVDIARSKDDAEMERAFWNTYHCQSHIISHENRLYGKYCKNRHCPLCCSIRKAVLINKYLPTIRQWDAPCFVTLTVKACRAARLREILKAMIRGFRIITTKVRKRSKANGTGKMQGIRALECCFNPARCTYNPHFHVIVPNQETGESLIREWLRIWTPKFAIRKAQHLRPVGDLESDLIETIKYGAKIFTEPDLDKKMQSNVNPAIYAAALYNIYDGMKGLRLFERFGFNTPPSKDAAIPARAITDYTEWLFVPEYHDWIGADNEQVLSNYSLPPELAELLGNCIDKETE